MSKEQNNKAVVGRWFTEFWGETCKLGVVDELAAPDMLLQYSLHAPRRGRKDIKAFMSAFREESDLKFWGTADLIAEGDYVVGRCRVAARTPARHSVTSSSDHCRRLQVGKCASLEQPYFASKTAKS
jgi:hypothetical protein